MLHARTRALTRSTARTALAAAALLAPVAVATPALAEPVPAVEQYVPETPQERQEREAREERERQERERAEQERREREARPVGEKALERAPEHDGKPYEYGATGPDSFDCSGYVQYVFGQVGYALPRTSDDQFAASQQVAQQDRRPGDLIAIHDGGDVTHVGIYAGENAMWVASSGSDRVKLQEIYTDSYYVGRFS